MAAAALAQPSSTLDVNYIVTQVAAWAAVGQSAPSRLLGGAQGFVEWAHYPQPDSVDPQSGWRFYYHAHPPEQRMESEHGHFHVFIPAPDEQFSHLIGISVSNRGFPIRLFTTNRWVTGELWQPAEKLEDFLENPELTHAPPQDVAKWLEQIIVLFKPEIRNLIRARDARMARAGPHKLDDHRLRMPSQLRINLMRKLSRSDLVL
ncbi:MAG: hypothetical protein POG24_00100 [Acidocella sp.]|nr:hypothetical protein [Acidocella sp.]MDE8349535.1 hypothetical protein [Acidocella sp.]